MRTGWLLVFTVVLGAGCSGPGMPSLRNPLVSRKPYQLKSMKQKEEVRTLKPMRAEEDETEKTADESASAHSDAPAAASAANAPAQGTKGKGIPADAGLFERRMRGDHFSTKEKTALDGADMHNRMGMVEMDAKHMDKAENRFRLAVQLVPDHVEGLNNLGRVLLNQGKRAEAIVSLREALRVADRIPTFDAAAKTTQYVNLADALIEDRDFSGAGETLQAALKIAPDDARIHYALGQYHLKQIGLNSEHAEQAVYRFNKALTLSPEHNEALVGRALAWHAMGRSEKALEDIGELEKRNQEVNPSFKRSVIEAIRRKHEEKTASPSAQRPEGHQAAVKDAAPSR